MKSVQIRSFFCSTFSCIRTEYGKILGLNVKSECRKIRTRKNFVFGHLSYCVNVWGPLNVLFVFTTSKLSKALVQRWRPATLLKKRLCHRCFPVNFVKFLRTPQMAAFKLHAKEFIGLD